MKAIVLFAVSSALMACTEKSAWKVEKTDLYRVSSLVGSPAPMGSQKPYFLVKRVVGSSDSAISRNVVQHQVFWCQDRTNCNDRDYSLQVVQYRSASESDRATFESGEKCTIIRHSLSGDRIAIKSDTYASEQFSPEECEAGVSAPLPSKFVRTSSKTVEGQLVQQAGDEA
jgi:hypothetical protein